MAEKSGFKPFQFDKIKNDKEKTAVAVEYVPGDRHQDNRSRKRYDRRKNHRESKGK